MPIVPSKPRRRRSLWSGLVVTGLLLLGLFAVYLAPSHQVEGELARLRASGRLRDIEDLTPKVPVGQPNAAEGYAKAYQALVYKKEVDAFPPDAFPDAMVWRDPVSTWSEALRAAVGGLVAVNERAYARTVQAAATPECAFPVNWRDPVYPWTPQFQEVRALARLVALRGRLHVAEGRPAEEFEACRTLVRMARHLAQEPGMTAQIDARTMSWQATLTLQDVLSLSDPTPQQCRALLAGFARIDLASSSVRAQQAELAHTPLMFEAMRTGAMPMERYLPTDVQFLGRRFHPEEAYRTVGRPLLDRDEVALLQWQERAVKAWGQPWPESRRRLAAMETERDRQSPYFGVISIAQFGFVYSRSAENRERATAQLNAAQVALMLRLFRYEHGSYPDDLATLGRAGWKLPLDPFTHRPYEYRRVGKGFLLYSLGPDGRSQNGRPWQSTTPQEYDIPFECGR